MPQVLDHRVRKFQKIKAQRRREAIARAKAPGAPNDTIARNVLKWQERQQQRQAQG